jgi:hypothetical protein
LKERGFKVVAVVVVEKREIEDWGRGFEVMSVEDGKRGLQGLESRDTSWRCGTHGLVTTTATLASPRQLAQTIT